MKTSKKTILYAASTALVALLTTVPFGCGEGRTPKASPERMERHADTPAAAACFDGQRALAHVEKLVALGSRTPGSDGAKAARAFIEKELGSYGLAPKVHAFSAYTPHEKLPKVELANITADISGPGPTVIVGGHYDTKILEGIDFVGANDAGSSTALLLEAARCLKLHGAPSAVRIAFFDGEEAFVSWTDADSLYGSKRMAADLVALGERDRIAAMVNVDMIGDRDLCALHEGLSTPWVLEALVRSAERQGLSSIFCGARASIEDDHVPFLRVGIPAADLIDFTYGSTPGSNEYWHTASDTLDKLSAKSLSAVGRTVLGALGALSRGAPGGTDTARTPPAP